MTIRKILPFIFAALLGSNGLAQHNTFRGRMLDARTLEPLAFASVFINYTTIGINADEKGEFVLTGIPEGEQEFVCSHVGYQSHQFRISQGRPIAFQEIKLSSVELKAIEISGAKDEAWNSQLKKFETLFLGEGKSTHCKILNPWVLEFTEGDDDLFAATASEILEIENYHLGYKVWYHLKNFTTNATAYTISGNVRFEEIHAVDKQDAMRLHKNRMKAYRGSDRHLLKCIIENRFKEEGYRLYSDISNSMIRAPRFEENLNENIKVFNSENTVSPGEKVGTWHVILKPRLEVHYTRQQSLENIYHDVSYAISWIEMLGESLEVNVLGIVQNPSQMVVLGSMSKARIAGLLPYDYWPDKPIAIAGPDR